MQTHLYIEFFETHSNKFVTCQMFLALVTHPTPPWIGWQIVENSLLSPHTVLLRHSPVGLNSSGREHFLLDRHDPFPPHAVRAFWGAGRPLHNYSVWRDWQFFMSVGSQVTT